MAAFPVTRPHQSPIRSALPRFIQARIDRHYLDISVSRVLPLACLIIFGVLAGLVFNTGISHPYDKVIHIVFYALLTLSVHTFFCCRLRISALVAFVLGLAGEMAQSLLPHREASLADTAANTIGIALVVAAIALTRLEIKQAVSASPTSPDEDQPGPDPLYSEDSASGSAVEK
ncbi:MAG: VanZ family protein [Roseibium sp.]|nr:VanZ family protein [Roseibium sp.]